MDRFTLHKRSVSIAGHQTSVSLEGAFWVQLKAMADGRQIPLNKLIEEIDETRVGNLSSAIRIYVLTQLEEQIGN